MAEIFISYARDNLDQVRPVIANLENEGYSVFWDREILAGERWKRKLGEEINAASTVILAWSEISIKSKYVLDEADEAEDQEKLVPIRIENVRPPFPYATLHYEDFMDWAGDPEDECWDRLMLRVGSMVSPELPSNERFKLSFDQSNDAAHEKRGDVPNFTVERRRRRRNLSWGTIGLSAVVMTAAFGANFLADFWGVADQWRVSVLTASIALAAIVFTLFRLAEIGLSRQFHVLAARWLLPVEGGVQVKVGEAFNNLFNAVYGRNHISGKCLLRSIVSSLFFFAVAMSVLLLSGFADPAVYFGFLRSALTGESLSGIDPSISTGIVAGALLSPMLLIFIPNIVADYVSLFQTREFLRVLERRPSARWVLAAADILLTTVIFLVVAFVVFSLVAMLSDDTASSSAADLASDYFSLITMDTVALRLREVDYVSTAFFAHSLLGALMTTYGTSLWLLLTLILGPLFSLLLWNRHTGPTALGRMVKVRNQPFTALGYLMALSVMFIGLVVWAVLLINDNLSLVSF